MKQTFQILNVKCNGCATRVRNALESQFGSVEVNLDVMPREITLEIDDSNIDSLKQKCKSLGYPFANEELDTIEQISTKAKSFVSCAIGKIENKD